MATLLPFGPMAPSGLPGAGQMLPPLVVGATPADPQSHAPPPPPPMMNPDQWLFPIQQPALNPDSMRLDIF